VGRYAPGLALINANEYFWNWNWSWIMAIWSSRSSKKTTQSKTAVINLNILMIDAKKTGVIHLALVAFILVAIKTVVLVEIEDVVLSPILVRAECV